MKTWPWSRGRLRSWCDGRARSGWTSSRTRPTPRRTGRAPARRSGSNREVRVDYFVAIAGTGGTFVGTSAALKRHNPRVKCFVVEPAGAPVLAGRRVTSQRAQDSGDGIRPGPRNLELHRSATDTSTVTDAEVGQRTRRLLGSQGGHPLGVQRGRQRRSLSQASEAPPRIKDHRHRSFRTPA